MDTQAVWLFDSTEVGDALSVRDAVARLVVQSFPRVQRSAAWIVLTELITNVVRHAPGIGEVRLEVLEGRPIVHVLDRGPGSVPRGRLPDNPMSDSGRGLFIVAALAERFHTMPRPDGGTHAVAVLK